MKKQEQRSWLYDLGLNAARKLNLWALNVARDNLRKLSAASGRAAARAARAERNCLVNEAIERRVTASPPENPVAVEIPVKLCFACQTSYPMGAWQQLELLEATAERTEKGTYPRQEKRRCAQCKAELSLDLQHYEDHDYSVPPRVKPWYDRMYGP